MLHKLRSFLTTLGIMFGVSAVIIMVAIGEGNKEVMLKQIESLGANNVIVRSIKPQESNSTQARERTLAYGIKRLDLRRIEASVTMVKRLVPLKKVGATALHGNRQVPIEAFGTTPALIDVASLRVARGRYLSDHDMEHIDNIAVLGASVAQRLFPLEDPLLSEVRIGEQTFKVVGVLAPVGLAGGAGTALVGRDLNFDVHIPLSAANIMFGDTIVKRSTGSFEREQIELYELFIEAEEEKDGGDVMLVADQVRRIMDLTHPGLADVTIIVPLELRIQRQRASLMLNALMTAIAAISLLIGGIGIMNIMLASVTERTREIGIRRALGATRRHIIAQFLVETTVLSSVGGLIGVALGVGGAAGVGMFNNLIEGIEKPLVTAWPILISFIVASTVGVVFGLYPAIKAASQDPIVALRHD